MAGASALFESDNAADVRDELRRSHGDLLDALDRGLVGGLRGSESDTALYAATAHELSSWLVHAWADQPRRSPSTPAMQWELLVRLLEREAAVAPFVSWAATSFAPGDAVALHLTDTFRRWMALKPVELSTERSMRTVADHDAERFIRRVERQLDRAGEEPLQRLMDVFDLSKSDLGRLFGVTRQAIDRWAAGEVPAERKEKLTAMLALADLLERKLKAGRVPGVARRRAEAYGGLTMLEMIAADRHDELLASVRDTFDWARAA
ncbi:MAG TPA: hypothetical protein VGM91_06955 [Conexibacter sp.]|jgi:hypothetical protein